jgi:hypothetical protein
MSSAGTIPKYAFSLYSVLNAHAPFPTSREPHAGSGSTDHQSE